MLGIFPFLDQCHIFSLNQGPIPQNIIVLDVKIEGKEEFKKRVYEAASRLSKKKNGCLL